MGPLTAGRLIVRPGRGACSWSGSRHHHDGPAPAVYGDVLGCSGNRWTASVADSDGLMTAPAASRRVTRVRPLLQMGTSSRSIARSTARPATRRASGNATGAARPGLGQGRPRFLPVRQPGRSADGLPARHRKLRHRRTAGGRHGQSLWKLRHTGTDHQCARGMPNSLRVRFTTRSGVVVRASSTARSALSIRPRRLYGSTCGRNVSPGFWG